MPPPHQATLRRTGFWIWLTIGYTALLVYATLFPLSGWRSPPAPPWALVLYAERPTSYTDALTNALVYIPFGFAFMWGLASWYRAAKGVFLVTLAGSLLSLGLESLQAYMPGRVPSGIDVVLNTASAAIGAMVAAISQKELWLGRQLLSFRQRHLRPGALTDLGLAVLALWALSQLSPLIPSLDIGNLRQGLKPLWYTANGLADFKLADFSGYAFSVLGLCLIADSIIDRRYYRLKFISIFFIVVLALKVPIVGRQLSLEALGGMAAAVFAYAMVQRLPRRALLSMAATGILAAVLISGLGAGTGDSSTIRPLNWVPFRPNLANPLTGLLDILGGVWPFVALAYIALLLRPGRLAAVAGAIGVFALIFFIEWKQQYIPGRHADITDVIVALVGWTMPWLHRRFFLRPTNNRPSRLRGDFSDLPRQEEP